MDDLNYPAEAVRTAYARGKAEATLEICICAAIQMDGGCVLRGQRHSDCFIAAERRGWQHMKCVQGFVTSRNRFVDRKEGMRLQLAAEVPSHDTYRGDILFSEDLY